jgi:hypothetical protein
MQRGQVLRLRGRDVPGGPLDAAGFVPHNPSDPFAGGAAFGVEVKNVRGWLYSWSHEVWDLLAKMGEFPDVLPILVARRARTTTFRMFKDAGAIGFDTRRQWFRQQAGAATIEPETFERVKTTFGFRDAILLREEPGPLRYSNRSSPKRSIRSRKAAAIRLSSRSKGAGSRSRRRRGLHRPPCRADGCGREARDARGVRSSCGGRRTPQHRRLGAPPA